MSARPVVIDGCFGWFHPAAGARGVVLCSAHGQEEIWVHRSWRALADQLAGAGLPTLRFDYPGTGDSPGDDEDPARVAAWLGSISRAVEWMRSQAGVEEVALVGLRLGGTLAAAAASQLDQIQALALLAAPASGRAYAREMRAAAMLAPSMHGAPPTPPEWKDDLEAAGFVITAETLADLGQVDLLKLHRLPAGRVLLMDRPDAPGEGRLAARLRELGVEVRVEPFAGYPEMMRLAHYSKPPRDTWALLTDWLAEGARPSARTAAPAFEAVLRLPEAIEEPVFFGEHVRLFGLHCVPIRPRPGLPTVIFLNTGADHHVGANRMAVPLARRLAAQGFASIRFDLAGIGDSPAVAGKEDNRLYSADSRADVTAALDWMERQGQQRCVVVGLCSGAYLALHCAFADPRIVGQVLINPLRMTWREGTTLDIAAREVANPYKSTRFYLRSARKAETWKRALSGEVHLLGITRRLAKRAVERARLEIAVVWGRHRGAEDSEVARGFYQLCERGVESLFVCSLEDSAIDEIETHLGPGCRKLARYSSLDVEIIEGADHTLTSRWARRRLEERVEAYLSGFAAQPG
ncbi:MAG: alpha/beta fold hydrolase [Gemmatimonadetes bacterium]|nr:alpha/beta fold hydrolase [Gemmatimonadota bacterium]